MAKLSVTLVKSTIGRKDDQIATVEALGLKKIRDVKIQEDNGAIRGMIKKVCRRIEVKEVN